MDEPDNTDARRLAHDLLQSITIIRSITAAARNEGEVPARLAGRLDLVEAEAARLAELCQREVDGTRGPSRFDLVAITRAAVAKVRALSDASLRLEVALGEATELEGDPDGWERAVRNLLDNALRAAGRDGSVSVRVSSTPEAIRLSVGDSGPGFGEGPTGRSALGLVTVSRVAESHDGHLEIRRGPLGGAEVTIVVPRTD